MCCVLCVVCCVLCVQIEFNIFVLNVSVSGNLMCTNASVRRWQSDLRSEEAAFLSFMKQKRRLWGNWRHCWCVNAAVVVVVVYDM